MQDPKRLPEQPPRSTSFPLSGDRSPFGVRARPRLEPTSSRLLKKGVQRGEAPLLGVWGCPTDTIFSPLPGQEGGQGDGRPSRDKNNDGSPDKEHVLRVVAADEGCKKNEAAIDWNIQGQQGVAGLQPRKGVRSDELRTPFQRSAAEASPTSAAV